MPPMGETQCEWMNGDWKIRVQTQPIQELPLYCQKILEIRGEDNCDFIRQIDFNRLL